jgi:D-beta-D-heptose 7-phosphate kinase/D-beta-D-heptose 1-phosphate adenosyltransferase
MSIPVRFENTKILVIGDVMLDRYWWGSVGRISPEAPVPIVKLEDMSLVAGGAANVAANLAGLGVTPYLFGVVGDDHEAGLLDQKLDESGISKHFLTPVSGRPTTIKTRIVAHSQHVVRIDHESAAAIDNATADQILSKIEAVIPEIDAAILSDYAKGFLTDHFLERVIDSLRAAGKLVLVDPKRRDFAKYTGASVITPNKREAAESCALDIDKDDMVALAGAALLKEIDLDALLITEGEHGMTLFEKGAETFHLDPLAHNVFDVTGAGDTVISAFAAAAANGHSFRDAATLANIAAGLVVGKIGTTTITSGMISDFLEGRHHIDS